MAEGLAQGEKKAKLEDARNMLLLDMPYETIAKVTGLDVPTIQSITV